MSWAPWCGVHEVRAVPPETGQFRWLGWRLARTRTSETLQQRRLSHLQKDTDTLRLTNNSRFSKSTIDCIVKLIFSKMTPSLPLSSMCTLSVALTQ